MAATVDMKCDQKLNQEMVPVKALSSITGKKGGHLLKEVWHFFGWS